jgi:hypothetical protein
MKHRDAFGHQLHVGQTVNCPDGQAGQVYALGRSIQGDSIVLVTRSPDEAVTRHLSAYVVAMRTVWR